MTSEVVDLIERQTALDKEKSFIVQAPAGSGKTELLTQRFLTLLAHASKAPEEIIAITFTKKAASEMRSRVYHAIVQASTLIPPEKPNELITFELARKVIQQDKALHWNLLNNPNRLRIQTIDSLCASLTKQMPILAKMGSQPDICDSPTELYQETIQQFLLQLEEDVPWADSIETLLQHCDNDILKVKRLLLEMLQCRDQWLGHITHLPHREDVRKTLEKSLQNIIAEHLEKLKIAFDAIDCSSLISLICFAANVLDTMESNPLESCLDIKHMPGVGINDIEQWNAIAYILLTKDNQWRKAVNIQCGFPPPSRTENKVDKALYNDMKSAMTAFLGSQQANDELRQLLEDVKLCPPPYYNEQQWQIVTALIQILPIVVAHLLLVFQQKEQVDFIQMASSALVALGDEDNPTDLTLKLDYQIRHILVDEFQDTSHVQYQLIERLTAGWQGNDGRTLFLVGDPMQSIYRFRQAEVGLFIKTWSHGIGSLRLNPLHLQTNFRSSPTVINWINNTFSAVFPNFSNVATGAIHYSPSIAFHQPNEASIVKLHPVFFNKEMKTSEADVIINLILQQKKQDRNASIAILVRARSHLKDILMPLKKANIECQAVEIEHLANRVIVQDLFALTRALMHLGDRIAWLSVLRAPWCGLTLNDLLKLTLHKDKSTVWAMLQDKEQLSQLTEEGQLRLKKMVPILKSIIHLRSRLTLSVWVYYSWQSLQGPTFIDETQLNDANAYFAMLQKLEQQTTLINYQQIKDKLATLYSETTCKSDNPIQVMTIHKAKGLEFDTVIIPGLHQRQVNDTSSLMTWMEQPNVKSGNDLLIAPIKAVEEKNDPLYRYIRDQQQTKDYYEIIRLLYVACTRAKNNLHLVTKVEINADNELTKPYPRTFISLLWQQLEADIKANLLSQPADMKLSADNIAPSTPVQFPLLKRMQRDCFDSDDTDVNLPKLILNQDAHPTVTIQDITPQRIGNVVHLILKKAVDCQWQSFHFEEKRPAIQSLLTAEGVLADKIMEATDLVINALHNCYHDPRGRWILDPKHTHAYSEYPISMMLDNQVKHFIIDRTFVDNLDVRWIIDYKTSKPNDEGLEAFLASEKRNYQQQLENYAFIMSKMENRPIQCGLYFPLCNGWVEWGYKR